MRRLTAIISLMLMVAFSRGMAADAGCATPEAGDDKAFDTKAKELLTGKNTRLEKISALHSFVRDEIGQAKTQYG